MAKQNIYDNDSFYDNFKSLRESNDEADEDYLEEYMNGVKKKAEDLMRVAKEEGRLL